MRYGVSADRETPNASGAIADATPSLSCRLLGDAGVARVSTGSLLYRSAIGSAVDVARAVRDDRPFHSPVSYAEIQDLSS